MDGLTFDAGTHTYRYRGATVPSVTQILRPLQDFGGIAPEVLAAKADLGTRVHEACHYWDEADLDESSVQDDVAPYLIAWQKFVAESGARVIVAEQRVFDASLMYAGTLDAIIEIEGARILVDRKTSAELPLSVGPQTAAYQRALGDPAVTRRACIRLRPDRQYRFDLLHGADDWSAFVACLTLHRYKEARK